MMIFNWHLDPLLLYALVLSAILLSGIMFQMATIVMKHQRKYQSELIQKRFVDLLNQSIQKCNAEHINDLQTEIAEINQLIELHKKEVANAWMRLLEKTQPAQRSVYIDVIKHTHMLHCIPHCLYEEGLAERCIALEAIGLSGFEAYATETAMFANDKGVAPYACIALARLKKIEAMPVILNAYQVGALSTTQALSAIAEIPSAQIAHFLLQPEAASMPDRLKTYMLT